MHRKTLISILVLLGMATHLAMGTGCAQKRIRKAYSQYSLGVEAFGKGELVEAHTYFLNAYEMYPKDPDVEQMLALTIFARGNFDGTDEYMKRSEKHLLKSIEHYENFNPQPDQEANRLSVAEARVNLSAIYIAMGRYDEAIALADQARQDPMYRTPDRANYNMGWAYVQKKQPLTAVKYLRLSVEQNRRFAGGYKTLGEVYMDLKKYSEALSHLNRAVEIYPQYAEAIYLIGVVYQKKNQRVLAQKAFKQCSQVDPKGNFGTKCQEFIR